jgi:tRNA(Ile)-lysidine synthase
MEQSRESLETTGRIARHQFFAACAKTNRCKRLFLAHHLDDQAETVLWNLMRGSHGCRGMREQSTIKMGEVRMEVFRPLLGIRKSELQAWMEERKLKWREDASNRINDVVRNRVRNEALPLLTEIAKRDINPLLARAARADDSLREVMDWALAKAHVLDPQGRLHLGALRELPEALRLHAIAEFLRSNGAPGINGLLLESCTAMLDRTSLAETGRQVFRGRQLNRDSQTGREKGNRRNVETRPTTYGYVECESLQDQRLPPHPLKVSIHQAPELNIIQKLAPSKILC